MLGLYVFDFVCSKYRSKLGVAVSVLLCWLRMARAKCQEMVIVNMPRKMFDVVRMSGLDDVLPMGSSE